VTARIPAADPVPENFAHSGVANISESLPLGAEVSGVAQAHRQHSAKHQEATHGSAVCQRPSMKPDNNNANFPGLRPCVQTAEFLVGNMAAGNERKRQSRRLVNGAAMPPGGTDPQ